MFLNCVHLQDYSPRDKTAFWKLCNEQRERRLISDVEKFISPTPSAGPGIEDQAIPLKRVTRNRKAHGPVFEEEPEARVVSAREAELEVVELEAPKQTKRRRTAGTVGTQAKSQNRLTMSNKRSFRLRTRSMQLLRVMCPQPGWATQNCLARFIPPVLRIATLPYQHICKRAFFLPSTARTALQLSKMCAFSDNSAGIALHMRRIAKCFPARLPWHFFSTLCNAQTGPVQVVLQAERSEDKAAKIFYF